MPQLHRRTRGAVHQQRLFFRASRCRSILKTDALLDERPLVGCKERIHCAHEISRRAIICSEGKAPGSGALCRREVRKDIRTTESVDSLLWITDKKQPRPIAAEYSRKDRVLHGIGILKFIHKRGVILCADAGCERIAFCAVQRSMECGEQIVEGA